QRQIFSLHQTPLPQNTPPSLFPPPHQKGRLPLLRPLFSRRPRATYSSFRPQTFSRPLVQRRSHAPASASVPAVSHSPLPRPLRPRAHHRRTLCGSRARRSEEHTSELQSLTNLVCRLLLEKKKNLQRPVPQPTHYTVTHHRHS